MGEEVRGRGALGGPTRRGTGAGSLTTSSANRITPQLHTSALRPSYFSPCGQSWGWRVRRAGILAGTEGPGGAGPGGGASARRPSPNLGVCNHRGREAPCLDRGWGGVATYPDHLWTGIVGRPEGKSRSQGRRLRTHHAPAIPSPGLLGCPAERQQVETEGGVTPAPCLQTLPGVDALLGRPRALVPILPQPHTLCMLPGARDPRSRRAEAGPRGTPYPRPGSPTGEPGPCLQPRPRGHLAGQPWAQAAATVLARVEPEAGLGLSSPAAGLQQAVANLQRRHAEVCDPDVILLVQQKVFWFQIPVAGRKVGLRLTAAGALGPPKTPPSQHEANGSAAC